MIKRISLLLAVALLAAMMMVAIAVPAFADPDCSAPQHADHPHCDVNGPGGSEDANGAAAEHNPNFTFEFNPPGRD